MIKASLILPKISFQSVRRQPGLTFQNAKKRGLSILHLDSAYIVAVHAEHHIS